MQLTIKSKKLGRDITFSRPCDYYIHADLNGKEGVLGNQICAGGSTMGNTLGYSGDNDKEFETICRRWYRSYIRYDA